MKDEASFLFGNCACGPAAIRIVGQSVSVVRGGRTGRSRRGYNINDPNLVNGFKLEVK